MKLENFQLINFNLCKKRNVFHFGVSVVEKRYISEHREKSCKNLNLQNWWSSFCLCFCEEENWVPQCKYWLSWLPVIQKLRRRVLKKTKHLATGTENSNFHNFLLVVQNLYHLYFFLPWIYFRTFFQFDTQSSYLASKLHSTVVQAKQAWSSKTCKNGCRQNTHKNH